MSENPNETSKKLYKSWNESENELFENPVMKEIYYKINKIIMLNKRKPSKDIKNQEIVGKTFGILVEYLESNPNPKIPVPAEIMKNGESVIILYVFNHPYFKEHYSHFLKYVIGELDKARDRYAFEKQEEGIRMLLGLREC